MKYIFILWIHLCFSSCSTGPSEDLIDAGMPSKPEESHSNRALDPYLKEVDSDGDFVEDSVEKQLGRNPNIADLPIIRTRFLQRFKISVTYKNLSNGKEGSFVIDTKDLSEGPSFKYRVGSIFIRNNSLKSAAQIGRFSGHSHGEYNEHDFTWVSYPEIDSRFFLVQIMKYRKFFDSNRYNILNISLELESSVKLKANSSYNEIKNPVLTFRYYNYEKESFEIIHSEVIDRSIISGVNEIISTKIDNVDPKLIIDNFLQKGEFVISELTDYEIPSFGTTFKNLKASVKEKTIPIVYSTPLETSLKFVAIGDGKSFSDIIKHLFDNNFTIENNKLSSIYQFRNSLPNYENLSDLMGIDKKGEWFIFTNKLNKHYLDHTFNKGDVISLSYFLGSELATQTDKKYISYKESVTSSNKHKTYSLGELTSNSVVSFILSPYFRSGEMLALGGGKYRNQSCGTQRNCVSLPFYCKIDIYGFKSFKKKLRFNQSFKNELSRISIIINQTEYKLNTLVEKKLIRTEFAGNNLIVSIDDISKIQKINDYDKNQIRLRAYGKSKTHYDGVKLVKAEGRGWFKCPRIVADVAHANKLPINTRSVKFKEWSHWINWNILKRSRHRKTYESFNFGLASVIYRRFN